MRPTRPEARQRRSRAPRAPRTGVVAALALASLMLVGACAAHGERALRRQSAALAHEIRRGDHLGIREHLAPNTVAWVNLERLTAEEARGAWSKALSKPREVRLEAMLFVAQDRPVAVVEEGGGWLFAEDPFLRWDQTTPRAALRTLVRASDERRWDVLLELAPRRYRIGLSAEDLRHAWTEGEYAEALRAARDRLRERLADPIRADSDEAALELGDGHVVRLEREGSRWVVLDL